MADPDTESDSSSTKSFSGIASVAEALVPSQDHKRAAVSSVSLDGLLDPPLLLNEDPKGGCGGQLWPAGRVLAKYMLSLELGSGAGLVGIAVTQGCKLTRMVHITDQSPMLALMKENIHLNGLEERVAASVFDWGSETPPDLERAFADGAHDKPDIILAADCVYFEPAFPLLKKTLEALIGEKTICYFCFKKRRKADWKFMKMIGKTLVVREIVEDADRDVYTRDGIHLYKISAKKKS